MLQPATKVQGAVVQIVSANAFKQQIVKGFRTLSGKKPQGSEAIKILFGEFAAFLIDFAGAVGCSHGNEHNYAFTYGGTATGNLTTNTMCLGWWGRFCLGK